MDRGVERDDVPPQPVGDGDREGPDPPHPALGEREDLHIEFEGVRAATDLTLVLGDGARVRTIGGPRVRAGVAAIPRVRGLRERDGLGAVRDDGGAQFVGSFDREREQRLEPVDEVERDG